MHSEHPHPPESLKPRTTTQTISIGVGFLLFVIGLAGMLSSSFAGLHFSILHALIIAVTGGFLIYTGYKDDSRVGFLACAGFGLFFGAYSMVGFLLGEPGVPTVGYRQLDPYLLQVIPGFQELGRNDHVLNGVIALVLLGGALDWARIHSDQLRIRMPHRHRHA